ncbi:MAG: STAS domain-containing protein, partial [Pseudorhodobacter sp.]|nr:STAS domain-containing protein [Rhizobacter sp.]
DSSALAVLLECQRLAQASGRSFAVRGAPAKLAQLAQLYGMDELLLPVPTETTATTTTTTTTTTTPTPTPTTAATETTTSSA